MPKASKLPSGSWRVQVSLGKGSDGKYHYKTITAQSRKEAERLAAAYEFSEKPKDTVGYAIAHYIETMRVMGASPQTITGYESISRNLSERLRNAPICEVKTSDVQAEVNRLAAVLAPKTVINRVSVIESALKQYDHAVRFDRLNLPKQHKHEITIPTDEEILTIIEYAHEHNPVLYLAVLLGAFCGLRRSEMCALTWADFDGSTLRINKAIVKDSNGTLHTKSTKTEAGIRSVPVPAMVAAALKEQRGLPNQTILGITPDAVTRRFERVCSYVGIKSHVHALRHYYASSLIAVGAPEKYIQKSIGHSSMEMVRNVYGHVMAHKQNEIDRGMNDRVSALLQHDYSTNTK